MSLEDTPVATPATEQKTETSPNSAQPDANTASSSTAENKDAKAGTTPDKAEKVSMTERVAEVLSKSRGESSTLKLQDGTKKEDVPAKAAEPGKTGAEDDGKVPEKFNEHPAWKRIQKERDQAIEKVKTFEQDAQDYRAIQSFMDANSIKADEVAELLSLLALRQTDPDAFYQTVFVDMKAKLDEKLGNTLPADLQQKVTDGYITEEDALAITRSRAEANRYKGEVERVKGDLQTRVQQEETQKTVAFQQSVVDAVNQWDRDTRAKDPDYGVLHESVRDRLEVLYHQKGYPASPQAAVDLAKQALKDVKDRQSKVQPKRANTPITATGGTTGSPKAEPKNGQDIVRGILANRSATA